MINLNQLIDQKLANLKHSQKMAKHERDSATMDSRSDQIGYIADHLQAVFW